VDRDGFVPSQCFATADVAYPLILRPGLIPGERICKPQLRHLPDLERECTLQRYAHGEFKTRRV